MKVDLRLPLNFKEWYGDSIIDSFAEVNFSIGEIIRGKNLFSRYAAYDFNGIVWWDDSIGFWAMEIYQWKNYQGTFINEFLDELMKEVRSVYGTR